MRDDRPMAALRDDLAMLAATDDRCRDLQETADTNAEAALEWLRQWHPDGAVHDADLAALSVSGFMIGFMTAAQLGSEDATALASLYGVLRAAPTLREVEDPDMTLGLHTRPSSARVN